MRSPEYGRGFSRRRRRPDLGSCFGFRSLGWGMASFEVASLASFPDGVEASFEFEWEVPDRVSEDAA